jgi:hypothetical protein
MESAYSFIKITLLGLILGVLIVFLLEVNYLADDIRKTVRQPAVYRDKEYRQKPFGKNKSEPPVGEMLNTPKHKI